MRNIFLSLVVLLLASCSKHIVNTIETTPENEAKKEPIEKNTRKNVFKNFVYTIAPEINRGNCKVYGDCDCCSSDLIFLDKKNFIYIIYCVNDKTATKGTYKTKNGQLTLSFNETCVQSEYNWEYENDKNNAEYIVKTTQRKQQITSFSIEKCGNNNLLVFKHEKGVEYGLPNDKTTISKEINILESDGILPYLE